ncbi:MAG: phosphoribosylanthranilate isomerase [Hyphomicrobiaceae bacterium]
MALSIKICGLKTPEALAAALQAGADYIGLVFFPPSPRNIPLADARVLADATRGRARIVALTVDPDDDLLAAIVASVKPDLIQLHGNETPERVAQIRSTFATPVMKAIKVATAADAARALDYGKAADLILFDARPPKGAVLPGGNGVPFDWHALDDVKGRVSYMLSGGLTPENVANAIHATGATAIDVSSGVEGRPGEKDPDLIQAFIAAARVTETP